VRQIIVALRTSSSFVRAHHAGEVAKNLRVENMGMDKGKHGGYTPYMILKLLSESWFAILVVLGIMFVGLMEDKR
jgi:hypothetical protein